VLNHALQHHLTQLSIVSAHTYRLFRFLKNEAESFFNLSAAEK